MVWRWPSWIWSGKEDLEKCLGVKIVPGINSSRSKSASWSMVTISKTRCPTLNVKLLLVACIIFATVLFQYSNNSTLIKTKKKSYVLSASYATTRRWIAKLKVNFNYPVQQKYSNLDFRYSELYGKLIKITSTTSNKFIKTLNLQTFSLMIKR